MANIKKYNPDSQNWETWASNSATGVYSDNPILLPEEENEITVEDALIRDREDIELMKKNISWLALHGGRGGGGGGGSDTMEIGSEITVYDPQGNIVTDTIVWKSTYNAISYEITSDKASNRFKVTVVLDNNTIYSQSDVPTETLKSIPISKINAYSTNNKHSLRIYATDLYDNSIRTSIINIVETNVHLYETTSTYTVNKDELINGAILGLVYETSIIGKYILYWGNSWEIETNPNLRRGQKIIDVTSTQPRDIIIPYWSDTEDHLLETQDVGVNTTLTFYFILVSYSDPSVKSEVKEIKSTVVSPNEIAIQPKSLSASLDNITRISKASIMSCNFVVYLLSTNLQYDYTVTAIKYDKSTETWDTEHSKLLFSGIGKYSVITNIIYNGLPGDDFFEGGETYRLDIYARDRSNPSKYNTVPCYVEIQEASGETIPLGENADKRTIFDFRAFGVSNHSLDRDTWTWNYQNDEFQHGDQLVQINTTANLYNMGGKSTMESNHCRLTNKAYMVINKPTLNGEPISWIPRNSTENNSGLIYAGTPVFTLSIRFFNDFTPDDNRTIFNWGNYVPKTETTHASGRGILINNHDFYIQIGGTSKTVTGKLQDSIYHEIDIVFGRGSRGSEYASKVEVYHNGILLAVRNDITTNDLYGWNSFSEMTVGCYKKSNDISQYTNLKLQGVSLYGIAFTPYQIVCNWINNLITYELDNGALNTRLLNEKLNNNLITKNNDGTYTCALWDDSEDHNDFTDYNWLEFSDQGYVPNSEIRKICPIPIVTLDFSTDQTWSIETFRKSWLTEDRPDAAKEIPFGFYMPNNGSNVNATISVDGQGTTSLGYTIKNLTIDFGEVLFWPRKDWFPEHKFTLKADIVDSAHANNACIGKFVNSCAKNGDLLDETPPMKYFNANKSSFNLPQQVIGNDGLSIKHTLEGFPVLLLARFYSENGGYVNKSLGIYSFNLGREAYYNMGYEVLKNFRSIDNNASISERDIPPLLLAQEDSSEDVINFDAESWEGTGSYICSEKTQDTINELEQISGGDTSTLINVNAPVQLDGFFWSSKASHIRKFWSSKYGTNDIREIQQLCRYLVACPYSKGDYQINVGGTVYEYEWDNINNKYYISEEDANLRSRIARENRSLCFNHKNAVFYYVVCLLFGLVDSLGKNLNVRLWKNSNIENDTESLWFTCFYDMDTAMGIDNAGTQLVRPDVLDEELTNNPELARLFPSGSNYTNAKMYTVKDNKLWGILANREFIDQYISNSNESRGDNVYASVWNIIRSNYLRSVDDFMNNYFEDQTKNVGELFYNQDFDVKYVNSDQIEKMYGDRKAFVRDWMTKRIKFLDSYFGYLQQNSANPYLNNTTIEDCSYQNVVSIKHDSGKTSLPIVTSSPCIIRTKVGDQRYYNYYMQENTPTSVQVASSLNALGIQTEINNSDLILEIQDFSNLKVHSIEARETKTIVNNPSVSSLYTKQFGSLSSFTKFDLSNNKTFDDNGIDFIKLFKTWNKGSNTLPYSLTELNLNNTKNSYTKSFSLNLTSSETGIDGGNYYANPFENLTDIDIRNSCVTSVSLPRNIALYTLKVAGSAIASIDLTGQSVLKTLDFSNCNALTEIRLDSCTALQNLTLSSLPLLQRVYITNCPGLTDLTINADGCNEAIDIQIDNVANLRNLSIINVRNPNSTVNVIAQGIENVSLYGCLIESISLNKENWTTLQHLDLSNSTVKIINWTGEGLDDVVYTALDLSECPNLINGGINIEYNTAIENIQLPNDQENPVTLNFSFNGCSNLTRIFGNLLITKAKAFNGCSKFRIHNLLFGPTETTRAQMYSRVASAYDGKVYYYLRDYGDPAPISGHPAALDVFQEGKNCTNLTIDIENASEMFRGTNVDTFDVYYILRHLSDNVTNISGMFRDCKNIDMKIGGPAINYCWDNSPHWTMFNKCRNITNVSSLFQDCTNMGPFRVYGNHEGESNEAWAHQGLFTPLVNCSHFENIFVLSGPTTNFIADKNTFKLADGTYFGGEGAYGYLTHFAPLDVYANLNKISVYNSYNDIWRTINDPTNSSISQHERGNLKGFFKNFYALPNSINYVLWRLRYFNFGSYDDANGGTDTFDKLPANIVSITNCFKANNTSGIVKLDRIFTKNENDIYNIETLNSSFTSSSSSTAEFYINDDTLQGFINLKSWGSSFTGVNKYLSGDHFPYNILDPCRNTITTFSGFFANIHYAEFISTLELPKNMFQGCTKLEDISSCFSNLDSSITVKLTPKGFVGCTNLHNVSNLFYGDNSTSYCVPSHFFDLGFLEDEIINMTGTRISQKIKELPNGSNVSTIGGNVQVSWNDGDYIIVDIYKNVTDLGQNQNEPHKLGCTPLSTYYRQSTNSNTGVTESTDWQQVFSDLDWELETITIHKHRPIKSITNMNGCFMYSNFRQFHQDLGTIDENNPYVEENPDYCPFYYIKENGQWTSSSFNNKQYTFMWEFDGRIEQIRNHGDDVWYIDMTNYELDDEFDMYDVISPRNSNPTNYGYPPDIFRWCVDNPSISGMFSHATFNGRICPYWFKSIPKLKSVSSMFGYCTPVAYSTWSDTTTYITIPTQLFTYATEVDNLSGAFSNVTFYSGSPLSSVFGVLTQSLNVESIFSNCLWSGGTNNNKFALSNVFANNSVTNAKNAFDNSQNGRHQYVSFDNMFSKDKLKHPYSADEKVFYGYYVNEVTHEDPKTCDPHPSKFNYEYHT